MVKNPEAPHQAIIHIKAEICELMHSGQVFPVPANVTKKIVTFSGNTYEECRQKVEQFFNEQRQ